MTVFDSVGAAGTKSGRIGPGWLVLVCGPSGAGKDSLLTRVQEMNRERADIVFPRRVVTRLVSEAEDHDSTTQDEFNSALQRGSFAFWWSAHGLSYGLPSHINDEIESGRSVVCNVSRAIISELRVRYKHVMAVLVTAPHDILAKRLATRGRTTDGNLSDRIARSAAFVEFRADVVIDNSGSIEEGARKLQDALENLSPSHRLAGEV